MSPLGATTRWRTGPRSCATINPQNPFGKVRPPLSGEQTGRSAWRGGGCLGRARSAPITARTPSAGNKTPARVRVHGDDFMVPIWLPPRLPGYAVGQIERRTPIAVGEKRHTLMGVGFGSSEAR